MSRHHLVFLFFRSGAAFLHEVTLIRMSSSGHRSPAVLEPVGSRPGEAAGLKMKFLVVTGGTMSGLGKGTTISSIGDAFMSRSSCNSEQ